MKCLAVFAVLFATLSLSPMARAQGNPDDQYLIIYALIQQADAFENSGEPRRALDDMPGRRTICKVSKGFSRTGIPGSSISD